MPAGPSRVALTSAIVFGAVLVMGVGHFVGVSVTSLQRGGVDYDFRFYAMLLIGGLMVAPSVWGVRERAGLRSGSLSSWRASRNAALILLAVNVLMLPVREGGVFVLFGSLVAGLAAILLIHLWISRAEFS